MTSHAGMTELDQLLGLAASGQMDLPSVISAAEKCIAENRNVDAIALYRAWLKAPVPAMEYAAYFNLGVLLANTGSQSESEAAYRQAVHLKSDFLQGRYNLGVQAEKQGRQQEAIDNWKAALTEPGAQAPENLGLRIQLHNNLGRLYDQVQQYDEAEKMLRLSLEGDPTQSDVLYHWLHIRQKQCKWPIMASLPGVSLETMWETISPLAILGMTDDPSRLLRSSTVQAGKLVAQAERLVAPGHDYRHDKTRIAFVSGDFCMHAVSLLTVRLYEVLDRGKYEVLGFGWLRGNGTPFWDRVVKAFDRFYDITAMNDENVAQLIRQQEVDIVVDLQGLTSGARPNIIARGAAPVQIAHLGYPGTSAIPNVDYVFADEFIFPKELAPYFSEQPLYLADCFQVSDDQRPQRIDTDPRKYGLPADCFIFCAFNNNFKITPEIFGAWMHILAKVPDSILWLLSDNQWSEANLRAAAQAYGIDPARLYFAGRVVPEDYLARFGVADLFLDTFPYNAGTTANDVLWAGLPIVTLSGRSYVSRMAGSLLRSVGLPHLIATSIEEYEAKAIAFAQDTQAQAQAKEALRAAKHSSAALNTRQFAATLDLALDQLRRSLSTPAAQRAAAG